MTLAANAKLRHHSAMKAPAGDQLLPETSMEKLKALHKKDPKAGDRLLACMAGKKGDTIDASPKAQAGEPAPSTTGWPKQMAVWTDSTTSREGTRPQAGRRTAYRAQRGSHRRSAGRRIRIGPVDRKDGGKACQERVRCQLRAPYHAELMHEMEFRRIKPRPGHPKAASEEEKKEFKKSRATSHAPQRRGPCDPVR